MDCLRSRVSSATASGSLMLRSVRVAARSGAQSQVLPGAGVAAVVDGQDMAGRQLEDAAEHRERRRRHDEREVVPERRAIHLRRHVRMGDERADLRCEQPLAAAGAGEVHRLDADAVADEMQHRPIGIARVEDADGEHAVELLHAIDTPLLVRVQQHLGVGMVGLPLVLAERLQLASKLGVVVDFTVEGERDRAGAVGHRLRRDVGQVDDRQAPVAERAVAIGRRPEADAVRAAVRHAIAHARDDVRIAGPPARSKAADNAAH